MDDITAFRYSRATNASHNSNLSDDQLLEAFMLSNTENDSGAQTNAERSRPRALPEALEAFVCTFQNLWSVVEA